ncbi:TPA: 30S ribosomal protein S15 [Candidatus Poribacteria bacterium]|nr:30S ribosomal protein S15 [Candidatus Poribacteria bacterium]
MALTTELKKEIIEKYRLHDKDTGSSEVQIAILSERIAYLTEHLKTHKKDHHTRNGLLKLVRHRQKLLNYIHKKDAQRYYNLIAKIGIRG